MSSPVSKNALLLATFALVCTALIVSVEHLTADRIQHEKDLAFARLMSDVLPLAEYDNLIAQDCITVTEPDALASKKPLHIYRARKANKPIAAIIETVAPDGYSGEIRLLTGIYINGTISGVRVTQHKETPGLGDKIEAEKHPWITQFSGLSLTQPDEKKWAVKKDGGQFDAFAGATITPRAVINALKRSQHYFAENKAYIFSAESSCEVQP